jgi:cytoskeleton protein RodZ
MEHNDSSGDLRTNTGQVPGEAQEKGYDLKAVREARGITLHDIFRTSRVSIINLEAIENGDFDRLPTPFIAKSFIRIYAKAVGVDAETMVLQYDSHMQAKGVKRLGEDAVVLSQQDQRPIPYKKIGIALLAILGLGIAIFAGYYFYPHVSKFVAGMAEQKQVETNGAASADNAPAVSAPAQPAVAASLTNIPASSPPYVLTIEATGYSWIKISEDRKPPYEILLKPGEKIERSASEYYEIDIGNAGGTNILFQGKSLGNLGKQGEVVHLRLPPTAGKPGPAQ